jgi:cytoskeleton protein RodZ
MAPQAEKAPDPGQLAERFRNQVPFSEGGKRSTLLYAGFSVGILLLVAALAYEWRQERAGPQFVAPAREPVAPPPVAEVRVEPTPALPPLGVEEKKIEIEEQKKIEVATAAPAPKPPAASELQRIVVRAEADAWIEIRDASGRMLVATLAPAGSERVVQGRAPFDLVIGNAASVRVTYEGKPVDLRPHTRVHVARLRVK